MAGTTLTCTMGAITNGGSATIATVLRAPNSATTESTTANVSSNELDPSPADNQVQPSTAIQTATDVSIVETSVPGTISAGDSLTYRIKVQNNGPNSAHNVVITGTTSGLDSVTFSLSAFGGCSPSGSNFTCSLNNALFTGGSATVTIQGVMTGSTTSLTNSAQVTDSDIDSNPANNTASVNTTVYQVPQAGDAFLTVNEVVDNAGALVPRQPHDSQLRVKDGNDVKALFPGSAAGTTVGLNGGQIASGLTSTVVITVDEANPDINYLATFRCDGTRFNVNANQVNLLVAASRACTVTSTYIGSRNAAGQASAVLKIITTVDNTDAPIAKQPASFTVALKSGNALLDTSAGSANGVNVGVNVQPAGSALKLVESDPDYISSFSGDCTVAGDVTVKPNDLKVCRINNVYAGPHDPSSNAVLKVIKKVDNFNAPLNQQKTPGDFQLSVLNANSQNLLSFPGSSAGKILPLTAPSSQGSFYAAGRQSRKLRSYVQ